MYAEAILIRVISFTAGLLIGVVITIKFLLWKDKRKQQKIVGGNFYG